MNLSVVILPAKKLADGTHKIRISIAHNSQTRYYVTRFVVPEEKNLKNGVVVGVGNASYINQQLRSLMSRIYEAYDTIENSECYTCSQLLELIKQKLHRQSIVTFADIAKEWLELKTRQCKPGSIKLYNFGIERFVSFAGKDFLLSQLNTLYIYRYEESLRNGGMSNSSINMRIGVLRSIVNFAVKRKFVSYEIAPFLDYKRKPSTSRDIFLSVEQLRSIRDLQTDKKHVAFFRDIFMLSFYLCGMNEADVLALNFKGKSVSFIRQKLSTRNKGQNTQFEIQPEARAILDRYTDENGLFALQGKRINLRHLHWKIANAIDAFRKEVGIDYVKYYSARKTFGKLAGELGVQERLIAYCIGDTPPYQSNGSSIGYYVPLTKQSADKAIRLVFDYLASGYTDCDEFLKNRK